jgi:hypothetical protein
MWCKYQVPTDFPQDLRVVKYQGRPIESIEVSTDQKLEKRILTGIHWAGFSFTEGISYIAL